MGCDMHMYVEYKITSKDDAVWRCGDYFRTYDPLAEKLKIKRIELYSSRNYNLFSVLADVRNYDCMEYIADPRGLPRDVTDYVKSEYLAWGDDAHSCSYFTLRELIDYHNEYDQVDEFGYDVLKPLIDKLKQRADDLDVVWDFEWTNSLVKDVAYKKANNIRIVFWFDN